MHVPPLPRTPQPPNFFEQLGIKLTFSCSCLTKTFQKLRIKVSIDPNKWQHIQRLSLLGNGVMLGHGVMGPLPPSPLGISLQGDPNFKTLQSFIGLAHQGKDTAFRVIIEYRSLMDFGPQVIIIGLFLYVDFLMMIILACVET